MRVPQAALSLLKKAFPFQVTGTRNKRLTANGICLATCWMKIQYDTLELPSIVRCRNHDWLDWTNSNIFVEWDDAASQRIFEEKSSYLKRLLSNHAREVATARYGAPIYQSTDADVRAIFTDAQRLPARPTRPSGYSGAEEDEE